MSGIAVSQAASHDFEDLAVLFDQYRQFQGRESNLPAAREFLQARLGRGESAVFVARDGHVPVGFAQLYPSYSSVALARIFVLNDLFVQDAFRRRGVASRLLSAVEAYAWAQGAVRVTLNVAMNNEQGQALYEAQGWSRDHQFHMYHRYPSPDGLAG
jgi:ribosomal protein S18 acetylase RimI-like enzyme